MKFKAHLSDLNLSNLLADTTIELKESKTHSIPQKSLFELRKKSEETEKPEGRLSSQTKKLEPVEVVETNCGFRPHYQK